MIVRMTIAAALAALTVGSTYAEPVSQSKAVATADLNLASKSGMKTLEHRISAAAEAVCGPTPKSLKEFADQKRCERDAIAAAQAQAVKVAQASTDTRIAMADLSR